MFVDASALVAILTDEADARALAARMQSSAARITSAAAVWETVINTARILGIAIPEIEIEVQRFLAEMGIQIMPIPPQAAHLAIVAFDRFGKGRHRDGVRGIRTDRPPLSSSDVVQGSGFRSDRHRSCLMSGIEKGCECSRAI